MITIWHNPKCSKSRQTLALVQEHGEVTVRTYLDHAPNVEEIRNLCALLQISPVQLMRTNEARFKELGLAKDDADETLITAMAQAPILIERPVVFANGKAALGRPPEAVLDIL